MKYAVLFRGINVGGKNIVRMNDLKQLLLNLELRNIQTYVQSGNAVLESDLDECALENKIYDGFIKRFGFQSSVIIRNIDEMQSLIARLPFGPEEIAAAEKAALQVEHLYVYFLDKPPTRDQIALLCEGYDGPDQLSAGKRELYFLCHQSIRKSKLAVRMSRIFHSATVRNWKSICNLNNMLADL